jgi:4-amino-4-deoxy-L-arabinose transferase-like glycosyltransferase
MLCSIARYVGLTMGILGALGLLQLFSVGPNVPPPPGEVIGTDVVLLALGIATVLGLRRRALQFPAAILNCVFVFLGLYLIVTAPAEAPGLRRMLGAFCLLAGCVNALALFTKKTTESTKVEELHDHA